MSWHAQFSNSHSGNLIQQILQVVTCYVITPFLSFLLYGQTKLELLGTLHFWLSFSLSREQCTGELNWCFILASLSQDSKQAELFIKLTVMFDYKKNKHVSNKSQIGLSPCLHLPLTCATNDQISNENLKLANSPMQCCVKSGLLPTPSGSTKTLLKWQSTKSGQITL